jgi:hypothetical protein
MARIIGLAMKGDVEFEIASKSLVGFKRGLHNDYHLSYAFHAALDDWRDGMGLKLDREVDHDDLRLSITLSAAEYKQWCRDVAIAWRKRLGESSEVLDIAEAVNQGINKALSFIGLKVEELREPKKPDIGKLAAPRGAGFAAAVPNLKASPQKSARKTKQARETAAKAPVTSLNGSGHVNGLTNGVAARA